MHVHGVAAANITFNGNVSITINGEVKRRRVTSEPSAAAAGRAATAAAAAPASHHITEEAEHLDNASAIASDQDTEEEHDPDGDTFWEPSPPRSATASPSPDYASALDMAITSLLAQGMVEVVPSEPASPEAEGKTETLWSENSHRSEDEESSMPSAPSEITPEPETEPGSPELIPSCVPECGRLSSLEESQMKVTMAASLAESGQTDPSEEAQVDSVRVPVVVSCQVVKNMTYREFMDWHTTHKNLTTSVAAALWRIAKADRENEITCSNEEHHNGPTLLIESLGLPEAETCTDAVPDADAAPAAASAMENPYRLRRANAQFFSDALLESLD